MATMEQMRALGLAVGAPVQRLQGCRVGVGSPAGGRQRRNGWPSSRCNCSRGGSRRLSRNRYLGYCRLEERTTKQWHASSSTTTVCNCPPDRVWKTMKRLLPRNKKAHWRKEVPLTAVVSLRRLQLGLLRQEWVQLPIDRRV